MTVVVIWVVLTLSFFMIRLMPGNAVAALEAQLKAQGGLSQAEIQQKVQEIYGVLPKAPIWRQYLNYIVDAAQGNLGKSTLDPSTTVSHIIGSALPWTIFIVGVALLISFVIGISLGAIMASFRNSVFTKVWTFLSSFTSAIPNYLIAIVLIYLLADTYRVFPEGGAYTVGDTIGLNWPFLSSVISHAVLPVLAYVITSFGAWALGMKGSATSVTGQEFVRAAESRGLSSRRITQSYIGRNAMLPQVTSLALAIGFMFAGSIFIETYFTYPGIGYYLVQSIDNRDDSLMMGCFVLITISVVVSNFLVDLLYPAIDPRIASPAARPAELSGEARVDAAQAGVGGSVPVGSGVS
jgi:peptide/nickel transport system permease protein